MTEQIKSGTRYRLRRGKLVEIPKEWVGHTVGHHAKSKRHSKTRAKAIYNKILRAQDKDALRHGEEPHPENLKRPGRWHYTSGRLDKHRNQYQEQKQAEHRELNNMGH